MKLRKFDDKYFKAIYSKDSNRVYISYSGSRVMHVSDVDKKYDVQGKNGMQIAELVFKANYEHAEKAVLNRIGF